MHPGLESPEGAALIAAADPTDPLRGAAALRRQFPNADPELVRAAFTQAALAQRASGRFGQAGRGLLWTSDGLEQASRLAPARHRAARLLALGATSAADLTCGVGVDALALAAAGLSVLAVEADPDTAAIATANARRLAAGEVAVGTLGGSGIRGGPGQAGHLAVRTGSCLDGHVMAAVGEFGADAWFADPGRRGEARAADGQHRRIDDPDHWSPPWSWVRAQAGAVPVVMAKAAPGTEHEALLAAVPGCRGSVEWVSVAGDLLEACATWLRNDAAPVSGSASAPRAATSQWPLGPDGSWWGEPDGPAGRSAVLLEESGEVLMRVCASGAEVTAAGLPAPGEVLLDPDPAIVRSGTVAEFAAMVGARLVDPHLAYLVADRPPTGAAQAAARAWQVLTAGTYEPRVLRAACADAGIVGVDVLGRGRKLHPEKVARDLRLRGGAGRRGVLVSMALGPQRTTGVVLGVPAARPA